MKTLTVISIIFLSLLAIFVLRELYKMWMKEKIIKWTQYDMLYLYIKAVLGKECSELNYRLIENLIIDLGQLKWKEPEKTSVLTAEFYRKYKSFSRDYCEFPADVFDKELINKP